MEKFHFIGIKGTGMSALANILKDLGCEVSGSDVEEDFFTSKKLYDKNINIYNFSKSNIYDDKTYIASSCYGEENEEVQEVKKRLLPFFYYHQFIDYYFKGIKIGVSGSHGKTTTTSMVAKLFDNEKIAYLIGDGTGYADKDYKYFIFEACEYKNHFLKYKYDFLIINNIDHDHPDFFKTVDDVFSSFQKAANQSKHVIINNDDELSKKIVHSNITTFGMNEADISAKIVETHSGGYMLDVNIKGDIIPCYLPFPGIYMIYDFLAALTVSYLNGISYEKIQSKVLSYSKPSRRMEEYYYYDNVIIDDYAHHPQEIKMCLSAVKQKYPNKDLVVIFQPHTYTRTLALEDQFKEVFKDVKLFIAKTFTSKRENNNKELDQKVMNIFKHANVFHKGYLKEIKSLHNTVILFLGAGNIDRYISEIL